MVIGTTQVRFDFPLLLIELVRHHLSAAALEDWLFVDTLIRATQSLSFLLPKTTI